MATCLQMELHELRSEVLKVVDKPEQVCYRVPL